MRNNCQGVAQTEKKHLPHKNQDWTLLGNIYPCEQPFWRTDMLSLSTQDWHHAISMRTSELRV